MDSAINKYEPGTLENVNDNELAVEGWMAGEPFQAAVAAGHLGVGGAPTAAEVMKGLDSLHGETLDGLANRQYNPARPTPRHAQPNHAERCWCIQHTYRLLAFSPLASTLTGTSCTV